MASVATLARAKMKSGRGKKVPGILDGMRIKPADVADAGDDYAFQEYGVTKAEMERFEKRYAKHIAAERKAGTIREIKSADDLR